MNILDKIIEYKKEIVEIQKKQLGFSLLEIEEECKKLAPVRSIEKALKNKKDNNEVALIAEVKKASPSKGIIRENFEPVNIAIDYENAGATAISVLTDEKFFQGKIEYLVEIKKHTKIPILRKDFIIDSFQVYQSRLMGADFILLIVSALNKHKLKELLELAYSIGLEVLVEVHDLEEFDIACDIGAKIIGINNRNLKTFDVSLSNTVEIITNKNFKDKLIISESGISTNEDVLYLQKHFVNGILVGESLMKEENIENAIKQLMYGQS